MVYALIVLAALSRLLPHPANFAIIGALSLCALAEHAAQRKVAHYV